MHLWHLGFYFQPDIPEMLIAGRERELITHMIKYERSYPDTATPDAVDEYVRCYSLPGGIRAMLSIYRAMFEDAEQNRQAARTLLEIPVLALGGDAFIGARNETQMPRCAFSRTTSPATSSMPGTTSPRRCPSRWLTSCCPSSPECANRVGPGPPTACSGPPVPVLPAITHGTPPRRRNRVRPPPTPTCCCGPGRRPVRPTLTVNYRDLFITVMRGRSTAIRYAEHLADAGAHASIGSVGDSYDNSQAESLIGLYNDLDLATPEVGASR